MRRTYRTLRLANPSALAYSEAVKARRAREADARFDAILIPAFMLVVVALYIVLP